jgi:hypothetical protein
MLEAGLLNFLGPLVSNRVYPRIPQAATFPLIRYQRISALRNANIDATDAGPSQITIQIDSMGRGSSAYGQSKQLAESVRMLLHRYRGIIGTNSVQFVSMESESDFEQQEGDDITHWVSQRYTFYVSEEQ